MPKWHERFQNGECMYYNLMGECKFSDKDCPRKHDKVPKADAKVWVEENKGVWIGG